MELGKKIRGALSNRKSKVATEQELDEAPAIWPKTAAGAARPRRVEACSRASRRPRSRRRSGSPRPPPSPTRPCPPPSRSPPPGRGGSSWWPAWSTSSAGSSASCPRSSSRSPSPSCWPPRSSRWPTGCTAGGSPKGPAAAFTLFGGILLIAGALTLIINSIAGQAGELSQQVVTGFRQLEQWLMNSPLPIDQSWFRLDEWGTRIQQFLVDSQSTIAAYAGDIGTSSRPLPGRRRDLPVHAVLLPLRRPRHLQLPAQPDAAWRPGPGRCRRPPRLAVPVGVRAGDRAGGPGRCHRRADRGAGPPRPAGPGPGCPGVPGRLHPARRRLRVRLPRRARRPGGGRLGAGPDHARRHHRRDAGRGTHPAAVPARSSRAPASARGAAGHRHGHRDRRHRRRPGRGPDPGLREDRSSRSSTGSRTRWWPPAAPS